MIVTFVSECRKKSIRKTQRILDTYAYRIGRRTWQANLTEEGLDAIRRRLTKEATRSTAVACHRVVSRRQTELVWVVGNSRVFDSRGRVAVHRTRVHKPNKFADSMWQHLPLLRSIVEMSALWHDFGKAAEPFQRSLKQGSSCDVLRHEWLSLALFDAFVGQRDDLSWLEELATVDDWYSDLTRERSWIEHASGLSARCPLRHSIDQPIARWIKWLIVSHHLLPQPPKVSVCDDRAADWNSIVADIDFKWGYEKQQNLSTRAHTEVFKFPDGLPTRSSAWRMKAIESASALRAERMLNLHSRWDQPSEIERSMVILARTSLMLGDHQYSSEDAALSWKTDYAPFANTRPADAGSEKRSGQNRLKQKLDEHLIYVADHACKIANQLPVLQMQMPVLDVPRELKKASPAKFGWQNKAVNEIYALTANRSTDRRDRPGTMIINTAGTGTGKTTANAKMLAALNPNDLRVAFALGLRTLTLQTGDEYRERLQLTRRDMQVIIGSRAVQQLHEDQPKALDDHSFTGDYDFQDVPDDEFFIGETDFNSESSRVLNYICKQPKDRRLLLSPLLVCTIDHLISATEGVRGGRQIMSSLRLLSSDLVIDEIDDYDTIDLIAVLRLVHLVGLFGRDLLISSATITPSIALSVFEAFQSGRRSFAAFQDATAQVDVLWVDEFQAKAETSVDTDRFVSLHAARMRLRSKRLTHATPKRRGKVFRISSPAHEVQSSPETTERHEHWILAMAHAAFEAHRWNCHTDPETQRKYSIGLIRTANIEPCVAVAKCLLQMQVPDDMDVRIIVYHSRQVLILRSELESYLGRLLNRREDIVRDDPIVRQRLRESNSPHVVFIVVASPVCEVGRDHDYDWTVAEPSSMRSLIQVCGRVLRHREQTPVLPNVYVPEFNYRAYVRPAERAAFHMPGYEQVSIGPIPGRILSTKQLSQLIDVEAFDRCIDARPRMLVSEPLHAESQLADLEHAVLTDILNNRSRANHSPHGWNVGCHYLTAAAQHSARFRASLPETKLYLRSDEGELAFYEPNSRDGVGVPAMLSIKKLDENVLGRLWLPPADYAALIEAKAAQFDLKPLVAMMRFGELMVPSEFLSGRRRTAVWMNELGVFRFGIVPGG